MTRTAPAPLQRFVELFNARLYWESHEALEAAWRRMDSDFYHGLILYASAFVHAARGNPHGIIAQLDKAERRLTGYGPAYLGIDVDALLEHGRRCRAIVERDRAPVPFPRIAIEPSRIRGDEPELSEPDGPAHLPHHEA